jgi:shikimate dehydrogenase
MYPDVYRSPVNSLAGVKASAVVYDLIYNPDRTCFLSMAEDQGLKTINGLAMLIHQGALTLEILTGIKPPLQYMKEVVDHSIKKR